MSTGYNEHMRAVNEYGIPLRCVGCPRLWATTSALTSLENEKFILVEYGANIADMSDAGVVRRVTEIDTEISAYLQRLGELAATTDVCAGVVMTQALDDEGFRSDAMHCGLD